MSHRQDQGQSPFPPQQYRQGQPWPQGQPHGQPYQRGQEGPGWQQYPPQPPAWQQMPPQGRPPRRRRHIVRNVLAGFGGLIVVIIGISVAASAGHHTVNTGNSAAPATGTGAGHAKTASKARIGSAITLTGNDSGEQVTVTVTKVITDAKPGDEFTSAPAGDRLYAVQFRLADTGGAAYSDAPSNGAAVTDSAGQSYQAALTDTAAGCQAFATPENIAPGSSGLGCIVFEVPKAAKITQVQFTLDSGMGPQTGQWNTAG
jgi:Domain of unknown function (DUF4352)